MKIAQVSPLYESVPPKSYGGTERVVSYLTEELVAMGHQVTLFASGDSETAARLIPCTSESLRLRRHCVDQLAHHFAMLQEVVDRVNEFDIVHFHVDYLHFPVSRLMGIPHITTLHGRLDLPDLVPLYRKFQDMPVISISHSQRRHLNWIGWIGNVYHGLPERHLKLGAGCGGYLAFLGRISPEKRVDRAIEIALRVGLPLKIAAKVDRVDREYYLARIKPLLANPSIEYIGEITEEQKSGFLGDAAAYLFPIDWPEPFGLTMIEAMACGTPTIGFRCGSVPEIITHGVSGLIVDTVLQAVAAVEKALTMDRTACRKEFEARFTASRMAADYVRLYEQALTSKSAALEAPEDSCAISLTGVSS
jgi:glycosyltransferase involved in cell wall biosynthesis